MAASPTPLDILKRYWGYDTFRSIQSDIIQSILDGHDTLGLMPTGGGKSLTFQVPALLRPGVCVVVTPLIALMKDQVQHLRRRGILASAIHSGLTRQQALTVLDNAVLGGYKLLYVSPERLETELFRTKVSHMRVGLITVDEAHCISQWGYDFRPSYLQIAAIRQLAPDAPVLALTASATPEVAVDIQRQLGFPQERVFRMSFARDNLSYIVRPTPDKEGQLLHILRSVPGTAIVYTRNRQQTHEVARLLSDEGIPATPYHAGLPQNVKDERQEAWQRGETRVMVATNAFGMGIDKPDVRLVLHLEAPDSPEAYYQEAGRAGRDGQPAYAVLLTDSRDGTRLLRRIVDTYPEEDYIRLVYEHLCYYCQLAMDDGQGMRHEFHMADFCKRFHHFPTQARSALLLLSGAGYIQYSEDDENPSRVFFRTRRDELYRLRQQPAGHDLVIQALLRKYSGLFADPVPIDLEQVAQATGLSTEAVHMALKQLAENRIVDYVPRKRVTHVTFLRRRVEASSVSLPPAVYAERRDQYRRRVEAMVAYLTDTATCRSRFLLAYFGEHDTPACTRCDVCRSAAQAPPSPHTPTPLRRSLLALLEQGPQLASALTLPGHTPEAIALELQLLVQEETIIRTTDHRFALNRTN